MEKANWKHISSIITDYNKNRSDIDDKIYQIYEFIEDDNKRGIVKILKSGININTDYDGSNPLIKCMEFNRFDIAQYFIKFCGANPNFRETKDEGALWYSLRNQKIDFFLLFLESQPNIVRGNNNQVLLIEAAKLSNVQIVEALVSNKRIKVNEKDGYGNTALHYVLAKNPMTEEDVNIARILLNAGADDASMNVAGEKPGEASEDSMANNVLHENKLMKQMELAKAKLEAEAALNNTPQVELEIEYEEVMEIDPITNQPKPVLRPKPKPRPLPKPTPSHIRKKI